MEFGMPILLEHQNLREAAALCRELGLRFLELNMNLPQYQAEELEQTDPLREIAEEYGITYTVHLDENLDVCDFNSAVARAYLDTVSRVIQAAGSLGVPLLNMHLSRGVYFTLPQEKVYLYERYEERYLRCLREFRELCERRIGTGALQISIENTDGFPPFQQRGLELLLESRVFRLTWDIGHSHSHNDVDEPFLLAHEDRLRHFHIHDAVGAKNHRPLGTGEIDLQGRLALAERLRCRCVVETKTSDALRQSIAWLHKNGWESG